GPGGALFGAVDCEAGEIPDVDDLDRVGRSPGPQHVSTAHGAHRPVGIAVGAIPGAADVGGTQDRQAILAEFFGSHFFAQCLHRAVGLVGDFLDGLVRHGCERRVLAVCDAEARVSGNRRHEQVVRCRARQQACGIRDMAGNIAGVVDYRVPLVAFERIEVVVAVADEGLQVREHVIVGSAAIEQAHFMAAAQRLADHVGAYVAGTAEDEDLKRLAFSPARLRSCGGLGQSAADHCGGAKEACLEKSSSLLVHCVVRELPSVDSSGGMRWKAGGGKTETCVWRRSPVGRAPTAVYSGTGGASRYGAGARGAGSYSGVFPGGGGAELWAGRR